MSIIPLCSHKFEGRYDFCKFGDVARRVYVRDICINCGQTIDRPMLVRDRLELGLITHEEARAEVSAQEVK